MRGRERLIERERERERERELIRWLAEKFISFIVHIMMSYLLLTFLTMGSKHGNTNEKSVWTIGGGYVNK